MTKVDGAIENLIQGVSQQARNDRREGQGVSQDNMTSDVVKGLSTRAATVHIAEMMTSTDAFSWHEWPVGTDNLLVAVGNDTMRVFDLADGSEKTVGFGTNPAFNTSTPVGQGTGTAIGDMIGDGGLAAAFDSVQLDAEAASATLAAVASAFIGKDWGMGVSKTIDAYSVWPSTDTGFVGSAATRLSIKLWGSDTLPTTPLDGTALHTTNAIDDVTTEVKITEGVDVSTAYRFHWISIEPDTAADILVAELELNETIVTAAAPADTTYFSGIDVTSTVIDGVMYLADRTKMPAMKPDLTAVTPSALVQFLGGQFDRTFEISLADPLDATMEIKFSYKTLANNTELSTVEIAKNMVTAAEAITAFTDHYAIARKDDVLLITWANKSDKSSTPIEITGADGNAGALMVVASERINVLSVLPRLAPPNKVIKVTGLASAEEDDAYFRFDQTKEGFGNEGLWVETPAPDEAFKFDLSTMPQVMVRNDDMTITFGRGNWEDRRVGDSNTNPEPTFVGKTVQDLGAFQGRLAFLTETTNVMSRTTKHLDFWKQSALTGADDDPIDIESTSKKGAKMRYLVPHNRDLVIFADKAQFIIFGRNKLTPLNASIVLTTEFEVDLKARPQPSGKNVFFGTKRGKFAGVREFFAEGSADVNNARPITAHVNKYIPGSALEMAASSNFDMLLVRAEDDPLHLFSYEFVWDGDTKLQSAWSRWILPLPVAFMLFDKSVVHLIVKEGTTFHLIQVNLSVSDDAGIKYQATIDNRVSLSTHTSKVYTLPYETTGVIGVQGTGCPNPGLLVEIVDRTGDTVTTSEDFGTNTIHFGVPFKSSYEPTMPLVKDSKGVKVGTGELIIDTFIVSYENSGGFDVEVTSDFYDTTLDQFSGRIMGDPANLVGVQPITSGKFITGFEDNADLAQLRLSSPDHLPLTIADIEWTGQWKKKGRRLQ